MIDIKLIRNSISEVKQAIKDRGADIDFDEIISVDAKYRENIVEMERLSRILNNANQEMVLLKKKNEDLGHKLAELKSVSQKIADYKLKVDNLSRKLRDLLLVVPNIPSKDTPVGLNAASNMIVKSDKIDRTASKGAKTHVELGESLNILDLKRASKISGSSFALFRGAGARLERALVSFMMDTHTQQFGYEEVSVPYLVKRHCMEGTGQIPKFEEDMYRVYRGSLEEEKSGLSDSDLFLIPTAEVPVTNIHRDEILKEEGLPLAYVCYSPCFRLEAGAYGKDTRGMIRVHQFDKVELVRICKPEDSENQHAILLSHAEHILEKLGLPYRVVQLCTGDMGFSAAKCFDLEVWSKGVAQWLEVSSCSNFNDFQARRTGIKFKDKISKKTRLVHTLNGSGVALARVFIAILENGQQADGSILIPEALRAYMGGQTHIK